MILASSNGSLRMRLAVLRAFCDPFPAESRLLLQLSRREWKQLLNWLDTSGLALYLYDRLNELEIGLQLPDWVRARLEQNCRDNAVRTRRLMEECNAIHLEFQHANLSYAILKGFSLWPMAVPKLELRSQLDLDFLIAEECAPQARQILEKRGYRLYWIEGKEWAFKTTWAPPPPIRDLYRDQVQRSVELHLEGKSSGRRLLLEHTETLNLDGACVPVLPPAELLLGQGMHVCRHLLTQFFRGSLILEFRRHVIARRSDEALWNEIRSLAGEDLRVIWGLGIATLLAENLTGEFAPPALTCWTVDRLPAAVRAWVEICGTRSALASFPGSKSYLLLMRALESAGVHTQYPAGSALISLKFPPLIVSFPDQANMLERVRLYWIQISHILLRLRFHFIEGARYARESIRLRRRMQRSAS